MIHVCYMTNDGYCAPTAVSAVSVFENHRDEDVCIHVLTEFVSPENEKLLLQAAEPYPRGSMCLHNCDEYIRQIREEYRPTGWKGTCNAYLYMFMEEIFPDSLTVFCGSMVIPLSAVLCMSCGKQIWRENYWVAYWTCLPLHRLGLNDPFLSYPVLF